MTFFIVTEFVKFHSEYFLVQFSLKILSAGRVSRAIEDVSITLESKVLYNPHDTCY